MLPATGRFWCSRTCSVCPRGYRKFVKRYGTLGPGIEKAIADYAAEVRSRTFPGPEHVYPMKGKKG